MNERKLRVLVVTRLFPNALDPFTAAFNRQQFSTLSQFADVDVHAVIPWFPGSSLFSRWSAAGRLHAVPSAEPIDNLYVRHPRVFYVPRIGHTFAPALYAACLLPQLARKRGRYDVVLGSWAFPDGVAAVMLGRLLGIPSVVKVHGSDLNVFTGMSSVRRQLAWGLPRANHVVAVSRGLAEKAHALGVDASKITVVRNGVDRSRFFPRDRVAARTALGQPALGKWIVYVGRLDDKKGVLDLLDAFARIADAHPELVLALVGGGPQEERCRDLAARYPGRVILPGARPLDEVAVWMGACDVLTLPSWNEGTPNVLLEAQASGRRVVATDVGGIPDVVTSRDLGELVPARNIDTLAEALVRAAHTSYDANAIAATAPGDWRESALRLLDVLAGAAGYHARGPAVADPSAA